MSLTTTQIQNVLGSSNTKPKVLTDENKNRILEMCEEGSTIKEIVEELQSTNDKVKTDHVKNFLKRYLKKLEKDAS